MTSKRAYQFSHSGLLMGETQADESPLEPGVWHVPARCTLVPPPQDIPEGKVPHWNGTAWTLVTKPTPANDNDPVAKLQAFLAANPDVSAILKQGSV
ncbi:hypothetical protein [Bradyrhizobium sp. BWC-3-1]|uniref:hypothetical protein n=1 Tax=Bradyrhizobium sp. BWC-3-1 TaxID=3080012 RepID=UPI00293E47C8|nr:hypothetical protein [Bradyrhizobium sp. BWC-3-1]WOH61900.1 hypothetical protein RX329_18135 [Bradyrhizobium sp. BWC-3-1]